jgi:hypothetical protein
MIAPEKINKINYLVKAKYMEAMIENSRREIVARSFICRNAGCVDGPP